MRALIQSRYATSWSTAMNMYVVRFYQPYRDLGKFRTTGPGLRKTSQLQQYGEYLFRRADISKKSAKESNNSLSKLSFREIFQKMFNKQK